MTSTKENFDVNFEEYLKKRLILHISQKEIDCLYYLFKLFIKFLSC